MTPGGGGSVGGDTPKPPPPPLGPAPRGAPLLVPSANRKGDAPVGPVEHRPESGAEAGLDLRLLPERELLKVTVAGYHHPLLGGERLLPRGARRDLADQLRIRVRGQLCP